MVRSSEHLRGQDYFGTARRQPPLPPLLDQTPPGEWQRRPCRLLPSRGVRLQEQRRRPRIRFRLAWRWRLPRNQLFKVRCRICKSLIMIRPLISAVAWKPQFSSTSSSPVLRGLIEVRLQSRVAVYGKLATRCDLNL